MPEFRLPALTPAEIVDWPVTWALIGLVIGLSLGVNTASAWLVSLGLAGFAFNLSRHDPLARNDGYLFSAGPAFILSWLLGLLVRGWAF